MRFKSALKEFSLKVHWFTVITMVAIPRQASLALEIVIVGGSIAGLACAYALAKAGHRVRVLERSDAIDNVGYPGHRSMH